MKTSAELRFGFWDVTAAGDAALSAAGNQSWARAADVNREEVPALPNAATLERDFGWPLDGSRDIVPDDMSALPWGIWSAALSEADGSFAAPVVLTVTFSRPHSSGGVTLGFVGTLPREVGIRWYGLDGTLLAEDAFQPDGMDYFCDRQVEDYGKLEISFPAMAAPGRWLRVMRLIFGALVVLDGASLASAILTEEVDPSGLTLPVGTLDASVCFPDGRFSLLSPTGAYRMFQRKQPFDIYEHLDGERRYLGVCYLDTASGTVDAQTKFRCQNIFGVLDGVSFNGGVYENQPVGEFLDALLAPEGVAWELDPAFEAETITGWLPICTKRAALQQLAFRLGAVLDASRREGIALYPAPTAVSGNVPPGRKVLGHTVSLEELVTRVDVTAHSYALAGESKELSKTTLAAGRRTIQLSGPARVDSVTGATLVESGVNHVVVEVNAAGEVTVTGRSWEDTATVYTAAQELRAGELEGVKEVFDCTLLDPAHAQAAAERLLAYYQERYVDEGTLLPGDEAVGRRLELSSLGGRTLEGIVTRLSLDLAGGYLGKLTLRGK